MKKLLVAVFTMLALGAFAQTPKTNGIIYKEHPYITTVNSSIALFLKQDWEGMGKLYADSAKFNDPAFPKSKNWTEVKKAWANSFNDWKNITITRQKGSYPDGFQFDKDGFQVWSYFTLNQVNKKTGKTAKVYMIQFDDFNKDGKIISESVLYDQTPFTNASK